MVKKDKRLLLVIIFFGVVVLGAGGGLFWTYAEADAAGTWNPTITLWQPQKVVIKLGDSYEEPGFTAADKKGNDLTAYVKIKMPDVNKAGNFEITYTVTDGKGREASATRMLEIQPNLELETAGLPICMYHYVYDKDNPPADLKSKYSNFIEVDQLEEELNYLRENDYYFPTWSEVRDYVDGKMILPEKSIVLCFDDGAKSFLNLGIPLMEKYQVPATSFLITENEGQEKVAQYQCDYVTFQSHSDKMHRDGGTVGHGGIFITTPETEALADLKRSVEICGSGDAFAYPYGDYSKRCEKIVEKAGFLCAVTTEYGLVKPGDDSYKLPRVRMSNGQSLKTFKALINGKF